ncbi:hypothetical protein [Prosthecochloris marina]|nr:hypothetical protein [Prosthecochloris marina]
MQKKIFATTNLMLITLIILSTGTSYAFKNEPDGFRGIKWGTAINSLSNMTAIDTEGDTHTYERIGDEMKIGNAELAVLKYFFWKGKLSGIGIKTKGYSNWAALKDVVFEKFGKGYQRNRFIEDYLWGSFSKGKTVISLEYNEFSKVGTLFLYSIEVEKQKAEYKKQQAKEGAASGF